MTRTASCARPKALSINKIGHALHDLDPVFDAFSRDPKLAAAGARPRPGAAASLAVDVHLQAAGHRRRSALAPGRDLLRHRADQRDHLLVRARRRHASTTAACGSNRAATAGRCASASCAATDIAMETLDATPWPEASLPRALEGRPARWSCSTACCRTTARRTARPCRAWPTRCMRSTRARRTRR